MFRIVFTVLTLVTIFFWGSYAQGWRVLSIPRHSWGSNYLVYTPYFTHVQHTPIHEGDDDWPNAKWHNLPALPLNIKRMTPEYYALFLTLDNYNMRNDLNYNPATGEFYYVDKMSRVDAEYVRVFTLDSALKHLDVTKECKINAAELVKITFEWQDKTTGKSSTVERFAFVQVSTVSTSKNMKWVSEFVSEFTPILTDGEKLQYEITSEQTLRVVLLRHASRYMFPPNDEGLIVKP